MVTKPVRSRAEEWARRQEAGDAAYLRAIWTEDAQGTSELVRGWVRGRASLQEHVSAELPRIAELRLEIEDYAVRRWGDVEVETFVLRQHGLLDGTPFDSDAPTTLVWQREGGVWRLALMHCVALAPVL